jgi:hypothetical protein
MIPFPRLVQADEDIAITKAKYISFAEMKELNHFDRLSIDEESICQALIDLFYFAYSWYEAPDNGKILPKYEFVFDRTTVEMNIASIVSVNVLLHGYHDKRIEALTSDNREDKYPAWLKQPRAVFWILCSTYELIARTSRHNRSSLGREKGGR